MKLAGKVAMVTGGASGIGRATVELFAAEGARVLLVDQDEAGARAVADAASIEGRTVEFITADVASEAEVDAAFLRLDRALGRLDYLVHCAGINLKGTVETTTLEAWRRVLDVNLTSLFLLARRAVPRMARTGGGSIVTVSSVNGLVAWKNEVAYDASKGGMIMMTRSLAIDHAAQGIRANCICPGVIDTPMLRRSAQSRPDPQAFLESAAGLQPLGRVGLPEDVARAALFLASDDASFVTGIVMPVDGGFTAV